MRGFFFYTPANPATSTGCPPTSEHQHSGLTLTKVSVDLTGLGLSPKTLLM